MCKIIDVYLHSKVISKKNRKFSDVLENTDPCNKYIIHLDIFR